MRVRSLIPLFLLFLVACKPSDSREQVSEKVKVGAEVLIEKHLDDLMGKRVGLVMNPTARVDGVHMLDTLLALDINVTALFAPEHSFRGDRERGKKIEDGVDQATGLPVFSIYGNTKKPTAEMLDQVDILLFDIQDVGGRFYTYNATLGNILEAVAGTDIPVWVLDRPNPAGGNYVSGWVMEEEFRSFVGKYPVPMVHGLTLGELAQMMVGEEWIAFEQEPELQVIPMKGWERDMIWPETDLRWIPPSPNLPTFEHAYLYLGTVLFEGTNLSEGRGTDDPFLTVGSPGTQISDRDLQELQKSYPHVKISRTSFIPRSIPGKSLTPKFEGEKCYGVKLSVADYDRFNPVVFGVDLLRLMLASTPDAKTNDFLYKLTGSRAVDEFNTGWEKEVEQFRRDRKPYLIY